jgi:tetratricopeptide (TPR) repeat protein
MMTHATSFPELLAAHQAVVETPQVWLDVSRGLVTPEQAAMEVSSRESPALIERSKLLFAPPTAAQEQAIRARILDYAAPVERAWGRIWGGLAVAAALALTLSLWPEHEGYPALGVTYQLELSAEWEPLRSGTGHDEPEAGSIRTFRSDQTVDFTLRPSVGISETELEVWVSAYDEAGRGRWLGTPRRLATTTGTVQISERLDVMGLTAGTWRLVFVVGRPGQLTALELGIESPTADHYAVTRTTIRVNDVPERPHVSTIVDYGPCVSTRADAPPAEPPRCIFEPEHEFRVLVAPDQVGAIEVFVDGQVADLRSLEPVDEQSRGVGLRLDEGATRLEVGFAGGVERWAVPLRAKSCAGCHDGGDEARAVAAEFYQRMSDPATRADWRSELPPLLERLGHAGLIEEQIGLADGVAHALSREHRFDEAEAALMGVASQARSPRLQALLANARGQLDWRRGRHGEALTWLRAASQHAMRAGEVDIGLVALPMYADLLVEQGYFHAAMKWSQVGLALARKHGDACDVAATLSTTGWVHLLLRQQGWSSHNPAPLLAEALAIYGPTGKCPRPERTGGVRLSLALLELQAGDPGSALATLRKVDPSRMTPGERVLAIDVELRARLSRGHGPAHIARALRRLRHAVEKSGTTDAQWHLALRSGQVLEAWGEHAAAIDAYREAEAYADGLAQLAELGVGRSAVGTFHRESSDRLVGALLAQGQTNAALCVARQAEARRIQAPSLPPSLPESKRTQLAHQVDALHMAQRELELLLVRARKAPVKELRQVKDRVEEQQQQLERELDAILRVARSHARPPTCEELHQPAPNELLLGLFPNGEQWLLFAQDDKETTVHAVELRELNLVAARARLSELLLRPVAEQLQRAKRIRVHAVGQAQQIDVELLPWNGKPLVADKSVAWGVDVVAPEVAASVVGERGPRAVLLADPTGSLPEAEAEVREATAQLVRMGWHVKVVAREGAHPYVMLERMAGATLLHYAGHAEHDTLLGWWPPYPGGTPGGPASLRLADETRLAAHEISIRQGQVPRMVILSGCNTGAIDTSATGTSMAVAFLMAGAEEVLATSAMTKDSEAREVIRGVYEALVQTKEPWSLVNALARAQTQRLATGHASGTYRVWVR